MNPGRGAGWILAALLLTPGPAPADTNYFIVAEAPGHVVHGDAYVLPLTNAEAIAHARVLIDQGPGAGRPVVVARIVAGADGTNRDYRADALPAWTWRVSAFEEFADVTAEILDAWPGFVEQDVDGWIAITGGRIGFWDYTVVDELPVEPEFAGMAFRTNHLELGLRRLSIPFVAEIESSASLRSDDWERVDAFPVGAPAAGRRLPVPLSGRTRLYRLRIR